MKLEYIPEVVLYKSDDQLIRLFDFNSIEVNYFESIIRTRILEDKQSIDLETLNFIQPINCKLKLILGDMDKGIQQVSEEEFYCQLTQNSYRKMIELIQPFIKEDISGYQWLYDLNYEETPIEFLLSSDGSW